MLNNWEYEMRIVALLAIRNEELYLERCLKHLIDQGVDVCVIDNDSTDSSLQIAKRHLGHGVCRIERLPYEGFFDEMAKMRLKATLAQEIDAEWFIHHDADEIREAPKPFKNLVEGIKEVDRQGYNAINFDEFVFLPTNGVETFEDRDYVSCMKYYYFFEPIKLNRINAWRKTVLDERFVESGGHHIVFDGINVFPDPFIMRHYIGLSRRQLLSKYVSRVHSMDEVFSRNMNKKRAMFTPDQLLLPDRKELKLVDPAGNWDRSDPWPAHKFLGENRQHSEIYRKTKILSKRKSAGSDLSAYENTDFPPFAVIVSADEEAVRLLSAMLESHAEITMLKQGEILNIILGRLSKGVPDNATGVDALEALSGTGNAKPDRRLENAKTADPASMLRQTLRGQASKVCRDTGSSRWGVGLPIDPFSMLDMQSLLPEACFIHIIQDGRCLFASRYPGTRDQAANAEREAIRWTWGIREARQQAQLLPRYVEVKLEDLIADPKKTMEEVLRMLALKTGQDQLPAFLTVRDRWLDSNHTWRQPLTDNGTSGLSTQARKVFESIAGTMLRETGYSSNRKG